MVHKLSFIVNFNKANHHLNTQETWVADQFCFGTILFRIFCHCKYLDYLFVLRGNVHIVRSKVLFFFAKIMDVF